MGDSQEVSPRAATAGVSYMAEADTGASYTAVSFNADTGVSFKTGPAVSYKAETAISFEAATGESYKADIAISLEISAGASYKSTAERGLGICLLRHRATTSANREMMVTVTRNVGAAENPEIK